MDYIIAAKEEATEVEEHPLSKRKTSAVLAHTYALIAIAQELRRWNDRVEVEIALQALVRGREG